MATAYERAFSTATWVEVGQKSGSGIGFISDAALNFKPFNYLNNISEKKGRNRMVGRVLSRRTNEF